MKKIIALVVAIVMMAAIAVPAFAAGSYESGTGESKNQTKVTYGVNELYVVVVPALIEMVQGQGTNAATSTSKVSIQAGYKIAAGSSIFVSVASSNYDNGWYMDNTKSADKLDSLPYTITAASETEKVVLTATVANGTDFMEAKSGVTAPLTEVSITFATNGTDQAGSYEDLLTFTAAVKTSTPAPTPAE